MATDIPRPEPPWPAALPGLVSDGVFVMDPTGAVVDMNGSLCELVGYDRDGLPYHRPYPWVPDRHSTPADADDFEAAIDAMRGTDDGRWRLPLRHRDGRRIWTECVTTAVRHGDQRRIVGVLRRVGKRDDVIRRERLLAESSQLLIHRGALTDRLHGLVTAAASAFGQLVVLMRTNPAGLMTPITAAHPTRPDLATAALGATSYTVPSELHGDYVAGRAFHVDEGPPTLVAPIAGSGHIHGRLLVVAPPGHEFAQADLALAEELASLLAGILEADRMATRERQLHDASAALAAATTLNEACAALTRAVRDTLGSTAAGVYTLHPDDPDQLHLEYSLGYSRQFLDRVATLDTREHSASADALRTGRAVWLGDPQSWRDRYLTHLGEWRLPHNAQAVASIPLRGTGHTFGIVTTTFATPRQFAPEERRFLVTLVTQAAHAIERAATTDARWALAQTLQRDLLPQRLPRFDRLGLAVHYQPAGRHNHAGGDWYDILSLDEHTAAIVVGDVVGHGPTAAAIMGQLRAALLGFLLDDRTPAQALQLLSRVAAHIDGALASTAVCLLLDAEAGELCWSSAGHPPPLLLTPGAPATTARFLSGANGPALGTGRRRGLSSAYPEARVTVPTGASVLVYTDGLVERSGESLDAGLRRLARAAVASAGAEPAALLGELLARTLEGSVPDDDVAVVVANRLVVPSARSTSSPPDPIVTGRVAGPLEPLGMVEARPGRDGRLGLRIVGEIDLDSVGPLREHLRHHVSSWSGPVTIDVRDVTYIDSVGIQLLAEAVAVDPDRVGVDAPAGSAAARVLALAELNLC